MLKAVHRDDGAGGLHVAQPGPEPGIAGRTFQIRIPVIGNHRKNGTNVEFLDQPAELSPAVGRDGGTEIIEAKKILRRFRNHAQASFLSVAAERSKFVAQYQRKARVLMDHSDVASAMPAMPNHRISTRFSTISSARFSRPQYRITSVRLMARINL